MYSAGYFTAQVNPNETGGGTGGGLSLTDAESLFLKKTDASVTYATVAGLSAAVNGLTTNISNAVAALLTPADLAAQLGNYLLTTTADATYALQSALDALATTVAGITTNLPLIYLTKSDANGLYATRTALLNTNHNVDALTTALTAKADQADVDEYINTTAPAEYLSKTEAASTYATIGSIPGAVDLSGYLLSSVYHTFVNTTAPATYALKSALDDLVTTVTGLSTNVANYVTTSAFQTFVNTTAPATYTSLTAFNTLSTNLATTLNTSYLKISDAAAQYLTQSDAATTYATKAELSGSGGVSLSTVQGMFAGAVFNRRWMFYTSSFTMNTASWQNYIVLQGPGSQTMTVAAPTLTGMYTNTSWFYDAPSSNVAGTITNTPGTATGLANWGGIENIGAGSFVWIFCTNSWTIQLPQNTVYRYRDGTNGILSGNPTNRAMGLYNFAMLGCIAPGTGSSSDRHFVWIEYT